MTKTDIGRFSKVGEDIIRSKPRTVTVCGKKRKLRRMSGKVRGIVDMVNKEVYYLQAQSKNEMTLRKAKSLSRRMFTAHAKTAACYILGRWACVKPLYAIYWRWLNLTKGSEFIYEVNDAGMNDPDTDFFLKCWQITNAQLVLSMNLIGREIEEYQKRMESATKQASEDGTPTSQDAKSDASSNTAGTKNG